MPEADPAERVVDRRERAHEAEAALQLRLELGQRDVRRRLDQPAQVGFMRLEKRAAIPAVARRRGAAGRAHPLHQLDRARRADGKAPGGLAHRAAALDRTHDPHPQVQGDRGRHHDTSAVATAIVESQVPIPRNRKML
jgi:hypothetical protein